MTMEKKHYAIEEFKAEEENGTRTIEGFASTYGNIDSHNDIVMPGAFTKSIKSRKPVMLWQHKNDMPIGVWDEFEDGKDGLRLKGRIFDTALGNDAYKLAKGGALNGLSIGFSTKRFSIDAKKNVRQLEEVELYEVSLVTFPANEKAAITRVKNKPATERELEEYLRDVGFSQREAKAIVAEGYKAVAGQRDVEDESLAELAALLTQFNFTL